MRRQILAVMDSEESYAIRFMEHVNRKKTTPFEVHAFTDKEKLREYAANHRVEILLISEHDLEEGCSYPAGQIVVLSDRSDQGGLYPNVCKYQASSAVMREVMEMYGRQAEDSESTAGAVIKPPMKIIGIFSPVGRCGKTAFALSLGQCLAKSKAALYFNFETDSGLRPLLRGTWDRDISDLIYYMRRGDRSLAVRLLPLIRELGSLGIVPPCPSPAELYGVETEEWHRLFESLRRDSSYEALILDLGELPLFNPEILDECDLIYMPVKNDETARAKISQFEEELRYRDLDLHPRTRYLQIPQVKLPASQGRWLERLAYGPVGHYAEGCISRDGL